MISSMKIVHIYYNYLLGGTRLWKEERKEWKAYLADLKGKANL